MNRIKMKFDELTKTNKKAFIAFTTFGYPNIDKTHEVLSSFDKQNVDIIEIGIPFSDPIADGVVIQNSTKVALDNGVNIHKVFAGVNKFRETSQTPLVFLTYFNAVYAYGVENFVNKCSTSGIDGVIIPDLPLEERLEINKIFKDNNIALISLVSPTSKNRLKEVVENSDGFIYCISSNGVTGGNSKFDKNLESLVNDIRKHTSLPIALGFGVTDQDDIKNYKHVFDGFIVGSEIVRKIQQSHTNNNYNILDDYLSNMTSESHR